MKLNFLKAIKGLAIGIMTMMTFPASAGIAVLDICERNYELESSGDYSRQVYSASYMCDIAGYEYIVTKDIEEAMTQDVILLANVITSTSFTKEEMLALSNWVKAGGTFISPAIKAVPSSCADVVSEMFGIDAKGKFTKSNERPIIKWNEAYYEDRELEYIDEEHERETSIGGVKSFTFTPNSCDLLASYNNGTAAVARNTHGKGTTYLVGIAWRDAVQRNQLNKDQNSSREYNNGFEPSSDVWALFLRSIYAKATGLSVWKFTVPAGYLQLLVPTHDCDSRTAYDEMHYMSEYEKSLGMKGHYFLTTHYFSDKVNFGHSYLSDFYNSETLPKAAQLLKDGHTVGSHSVCHFPDFNKTRNTDIVTKEEYAHRATCVDGTSTGVSTWAEIVMSKQILEEDLGNNVRSFRSGHLCVNPDFHAMLEAGDYSFQSCYTGGDILSEFPFFGRFDTSWEKDQSKVLTIQLHISDVYNNKDGEEPLNNDTWDTHHCVNDWEAAMQKLRGNYASAILLIHPNREWKMTLQKRLVERLDLSEVGMYNFEDYGDFWISRLNNKYSYTYNEEDGQLTITTEDLNGVKKNLLTYAIEISEKPVKSVIVSNGDATEAYNAKLKKLSGTRYLAIPDYDNPVGMSVGQVSSADNGYSGIYDLNGRLISTDLSNQEILTKLPKGIYIIKGLNTSKKIII
ncbi:MAG: hypothetical protein K2G77_06795 [Muribaculaceae bacterium]|nr:hypothetical protein [Muribaculaceae bacterium]